MSYCVDNLKCDCHLANRRSPSDAEPGVDVWAADAQSDNGKYFSGTSFATPFVTAAMAAQLGQKNKKISPRDAYTTLEKSAKDLGKAGKDPQFGWGLVQAQCW